MQSNYNCEYCHDTGYELIQMHHHTRCLNPEEQDEYKRKYESYVTQEDIDEFINNTPTQIVETIIETYGRLKVAQPFVVSCPYCKGGLVRRVKEVSDRTNLPIAYKGSTMNDFDWNIYGVDMGKKPQAVESFINDFVKWRDENKGLYIYSKEKGSGKTFLASCIANSLIKKYAISVKFVSANDLLDKAKISDTEGRNGKEDPIKQYKECQLLIIDDLGQNKTGEAWLNDVLFGIIDTRYQNRRVTIATSNLKIHELPFDPRIIDRINEMTFMVDLPEVSIRTKKSNADKSDFLVAMGLK